MRHTLLVITLLLGFSAVTIQTHAQPSGKRIEALKISFITTELDLSPEEAQQFWPIYNEYEEERKALESEEQQMQQKYAGRFESLTDSEARELIESSLDRDQKLLDLKKEYFDKLENVVGSAKVLALIHAERKFRMRLLEVLKEHRQGPPKSRF